MNQTFLIAFCATTAFCILWGRFGGRWYAKYLLKSAVHLPEQRHAPFINLIVYPLFAASLIGPWLYFISNAGISETNFFSLKFALCLAPAIIGGVATHQGIKPLLPALRAKGMFK